MGPLQTGQRRRPTLLTAIAIVVCASIVRLGIEAWLELHRLQSGANPSGGQADAGWNSWGWLTLLGTMFG